MNSDAARAARAVLLEAAARTGFDAPIRVSAPGPRITKAAAETSVKIHLRQPRPQMGLVSFDHLSRSCPTVGSSHLRAPAP